MSNNQTKDPLNKFQALLKNLFQFETADLDFGIYRILNFKRAQIEKFINEDLKNRVEQAFSKYKDERLENIKQKLEEAKKNVIENVNADAFTAAGDIKPEFMNVPIGLSPQNSKYYYL